MWRRAWLGLLLLLPAGVQAGVNIYNYRVVNAAAHPSARVPQFYVADTEAECPGSAIDGDLCYGIDTDVLRIRAAGAWATLSTGGGGVSDGDYGDITVSGGGAVWTIDNGVVTFLKLQNIATDRLLGRDTAAAGVVEELSVGGGLEFTGGPGIQRSELTGDVTAPAGSNTTTVVDDSHNHTGSTISALDGGDLTTGQVAPARGGTGDDTAASTGVPRVTAGDWTYNAGLSHLASSPSADLRGVLSDEEGTGPAMFGLTPAMADGLPCLGDQVVKRNAGDTAFECGTVAGGSGLTHPQVMARLAVGGAY